MRSLRGWPMADRLPELARLPTGLVLDGELVAFGLDGRPSFPLLGLRVLHGRDAIPVTLIVFDVLRVEGLDAMLLPQRSPRAAPRRRRTPRACATPGRAARAPRAARAARPYRPTERGWIKAKHRSYWRFAQELEGAQRRRRARLTI